MNIVGVLDGGGGARGVRFPDIDGCVGMGSTPDEAVTSATEALRGVVAHKGGGGHRLLHARSLVEILDPGKSARAKRRSFVPLLVDAGRSARANVTFGAGLLAEIDQAAKR